jgi:CheY-like chemotaxis protein
MGVVRPSVLLIHDDALDRRSLARMLQPVAIVCDVDSVEVALEVLATGTVFDAVVADLSAIGISGAEVRARLVKQHPRLAERFIEIPNPVVSEELQELVLAVAGSADVAAE